MISSTILTLIVVPVAYSYLADANHKIANLNSIKKR